MAGCGEVFGWGLEKAWMVEFSVPLLERGGTVKGGEGAIGGWEDGEGEGERGRSVRWRDFQG